MKANLLFLTIDGSLCVGERNNEYKNIAVAGKTEGEIKDNLLRIVGRTFTNDDKDSILETYMSIQNLGSNVYAVTSYLSPVEIYERWSSINRKYFENIKFLQLCSSRECEIEADDFVLRTFLESEPVDVDLKRAISVLKDNLASIV